jgi:putative protease
MPKEKEIGKVLHYFSHLNVAAIELSGELKVGDTIHIAGHTTDFNQKVTSMQIEKDKVETAKKGDSIGIKVDEHVRENDNVFLTE